MTLGNIVDLSIFGVLNLISAFTCYKYYYPEGYVNKKPKTKKVVLHRWSRILASCFVGFIHLVYWSGVTMLGNIAEFINLPWDEPKEDPLARWPYETPVENEPRNSNNIPPIDPPQPIKF
jgi:hypothetical protein